jgi:hypothetical protein
LHVNFKKIPLRLYVHVVCLFCRFGNFGKSSQNFRESDMAHTTDVVPPPPSTSPAFTLSNHEISITGSMDYDSYLKPRRPDSSALSDGTEVLTTKVIFFSHFKIC